MATNLAPSEILVQTIDAFKKRVPALGMMSTDFSDSRSRKDQTIKAHIRTLPSVGDYGANGYFSNSNDAQTLLTDVDLTLDQHKHVTLNLTHLKMLSDDKRNTQIGDSAYVLGKSMVDSALAKVTASAFATSEVVSVANSDFDALNSARKNLVQQGANVDALYGLVNSDFAASLNSDTRIASKDFRGQETTTSGLHVLNGVAGFQQVREYADLPANGENLSGVFFDPRAICLATRLPSDSTDLARSLGVPNIADTTAVTDPESGLSFLGIMHMQPGTLDLFLTVTVLYGSTVGGAALQNSAYRITSA